jgi:H+/Cl- antiporter ClcA
VPELEPLMLLRVTLLAWFCAMLSTVFCAALHHGERMIARLLPNPWIRAVTGGCALLALTWLVGTTDYNGAGTDVITRAVEQGSAMPLAFAWKMLFTVITLSVGFRGGEVVPCFFIGATFGCVVGPLVGIPAGFAAAVGLISVFCGAINCPITSMVLAVEMFGGQGMTYYALCCGIAFVLSGYAGLYTSQRILYDKLKARYIDVYANSYHEGGFETHGEW